MSTPSQKWNIDNAFCNDLNHGVVMVQLRIRCASTLKRKKGGLRQTSLNQGKWPNLSFVIRRKEGGVSYVIHSLNLHNGARNILRWISHLSYLFKEWESSWEEKKTFTHATEVVVDSSSFGINRVLCPKTQGKFEVSLGILDMYMCRNFVKLFQCCQLKLCTGNFWFYRYVLLVVFGSSKSRYKD